MNLRTRKAVLWLLMPLATLSVGLFNAAVSAESLDEVSEPPPVHIRTEPGVTRPGVRTFQFPILTTNALPPGIVSVVTKERTEELQQLENERIAAQIEMASDGKTVSEHHARIREIVRRQMAAVRKHDAIQERKQAELNELEQKARTPASDRAELMKLLELQNDNWKVERIGEAASGDFKTESKAATKAPSTVPTGTVYSGSASPKP